MNAGIGDYIKEHRAELGLNQTELAAKAKMTRSHLAVLESGKVNLPNADLRRRIAQALGVSHLDVLVACGEIRPDEIEPLQIQGVQPNDPVMDQLIEKLRRIDPAYTHIAEGFLDNLVRPDLDPRNRVHHEANEANK